MAASRATVHTIKVSLRDARPPIWRRLEVPSDIRLDRLSEVLQTAFDWAGYHLWVFQTARGEFGVPDPALEYRDAATVALSTVAAGVGDRLSYDYDFGDYWEHQIVVEAIGPAADGVVCPRCAAGRRAAPPEDCGGMGGYEYQLEILADPDHEQHAELLPWLGLESGTDLDPAAFDRAELNRRLAAYSRA